MSTVYTLDLNFQKIPNTIAAYLIPHSNGAILIECGPGSTIQALLDNLALYGYTASEITHVFLTHIHLDHGGAAGWLSRQGARIYVHHVGAPHLIDPSRLLSSAQRIYGDQMEPLWGEFLPVLADHLTPIQDGEVVEVGQLKIQALDTPGHANHHMVYIVEDICFSGDIGGVRLGGLKYLRLPMPPPELHLEKWRQSLKRLEEADFQRIAPTHFGIYDDRTWHIEALYRSIDRYEKWMEEVMISNPSLDTLRQSFTEWTNESSLLQGVNDEILQKYQFANPTFMSADGIQRYWRKYRIEQAV